MNRINIFFLVPTVRLCGVTTYTGHLVRALKQMGYDPHLFKVGRSVSSAQFPGDLSIHTVTLPAALAMAASEPSLISYCFWAKCGQFARPLLAAGVPLVIHDPAEFQEEPLTFMKQHGVKPIVIRSTNATGLKKHGIDATFIPHPYTPAVLPRPPWQKDMHAVCLARVDGRKRTETIVAANKLLPPEKAVRIYGNIVRVYEYHVLRKKHPEWRQWYGGQFPSNWGAAVRLALRARFSVDLTGLVGDGGGTQYTFFESWNARVPLILSREWLSHEGECKEGVNCLAAGSAEELASILQTDPNQYGDIVQGGRAIIDAHAPETVVPIYEEVCKWTT